MAQAVYIAPVVVVMRGGKENVKHERQHVLMDREASLNVTWADRLLAAATMNEVRAAVYMDWGRVGMLSKACWLTAPPNTASHQLGTEEHGCNERLHDAELSLGALPESHERGQLALMRSDL